MSPHTLPRGLADCALVLLSRLRQEFFPTPEAFTAKHALWFAQHRASRYPAPQFDDRERAAHELISRNDLWRQFDTGRDRISLVTLDQLLSIAGIKVHQVIIELTDDLDAPCRWEIPTAHRQPDPHIAVLGAALCTEGTSAVHEPWLAEYKSALAELLPPSLIPAQSEITLQLTRYRNDPSPIEAAEQQALVEFDTARLALKERETELIDRALMATKIGREAAGAVADDASASLNVLTYLRWCRSRGLDPRWPTAANIG